MISTGKGMLRQVSDNSNAHVLLHANDVIRVCRLCDHIDSISTLIENCQIGTTGCYCLSPSAYFIDIQNKSAVTWKITENCFQAKVSLPEFRRFQMTFVWRTAARYFADDSDVMNKTKYQLNCNRNEPVRLNRECEGSLSLSLSSTESMSHELQYGAVLVISIVSLTIYLILASTITIYAVVIPYVRKKF